jgi:predicted outer membrane repeat protein
MDRAPRACCTPRRICSILVTLGLVVGMLAVTASVTVSTAGAAACLARDGTTSSRHLQSIIDGASTGDTIRIWGTCIGHFKIPGGGTATSLTLVGKGKKKATLDGNDSGQVVFVDSSETVTFMDLLITNGNFTDYGGGIYNSQGTVNLRGTTRVTGNTGFRGGGIYNYQGTVTMRFKAHVNGNTATDEGGGGIYNYQGTVRIRGKARVNGNTAPTSGGGIYNDGGTLVGATAGVNVKNNIPDNIGP